MINLGYDLFGLNKIVYIDDFNVDGAASCAASCTFGCTGGCASCDPGCGSGGRIKSDLKPA